MKSNNDVKRFTVLGLTGSGKTCLLLGMCDSIRGINGYVLTPDVSSAARITRDLQILRDRTLGVERFPVPTAAGDFEKYTFTLSRGAELISQFEWVDYAGGILEDDNTPESKLNEVYDSIERSSVLYLCLDGTLFKNEQGKQYADQNEKIQDVLDNTAHTASVMNNLLEKYISSHRESIPPIVLVITKLDIIKRSPVTIDSLVEAVVREHFCRLLKIPDLRLYVVGTTLGEHISDNQYTGRFKPDRMEIPYLIGVYHLLDSQTDKHPVWSSIIQTGIRIGCDLVTVGATEIYFTPTQKKQEKQDIYTKRLHKDIGSLIDDRARLRDGQSCITLFTYNNINSSYKMQDDSD